MEAKGQSLRNVFNQIVLEVPFFQRSYVWKKENWQELLEDLYETQAMHFLGTIILKEESTRFWDMEKYVIIDGQQRLTTLSILIKALYDCMKDKQEAIFDDAKNILFYKEKSSDNDFMIALHHSYNDRLQFQQVIGEVEDRHITSPILKELEDIEIDSRSHKNLIKRCYKYFYTELTKRYQEAPQRVIDFFDFLLKRTNNILVVIQLDKDDREQKIFDSINSAGIRLSATDTIKNALYQRLLNLAPKKDEQEERANEESVLAYYKQTWEATFESDEDTIEYWAKTKSVGRVSFQNSELLLKSVATITGIFKYREGHTIDQLAELYKKEIARKNEHEVKTLIEDIIKYAKIYKEKFLHFSRSESFEFGDVQKRLLKTLDETENTVFNPYILYLLKEYDAEPKTLKVKLERLEKLVVRALATGFFRKNYSKLIEEFIADKEDIKISQLCDEVDKETWQKALSTNMPAKVAGMLLFWVELHRREKGDHDVKTLQYNYQLEHIMPKKWEEHWQDVPIDSKSKELCTTEELKQIRKEKISSIGNMTLLNGRLNTTISNDSFERKMEGNDKKKGLKAYSSLLITREDIVEKVYNQKKQWNETEIVKREKALADEIIDIWG